MKVQAKQCATCIYRQDSPLDLRQLEREAAQKDTFRICHHSDNACCRGFWDRHKDHFNLGRIAQRLQMVTFVNHDTHEPVTRTR